MEKLQGIAGFFIFIFCGYLLSENKRNINWKLIISALIFQGILALILSKLPLASEFLIFISKCFVKLLDFSLYGARFLFGPLSESNSTGSPVSLGFIFAFQVLPVIVFFSTFSAGLYYLGILQKLVFLFAWLMSKTIRISGTESLCTTANIFMGQTEAPLLVKPFIAGMNRSEIMCIMTAGMATIAGGVMAAYVAFLGGESTTGKIAVASQLLTASVLNAPGAIIFAKLMVPQTEATDTNLKFSKEKLGVNLMEALTIGAADGVKLAANVAGMLLVFISLVALLNYGLNFFGEISGINTIIKNAGTKSHQGLNLQLILGQLYRPFAFLMGVHWDETLQVGSLIGQKTVINEFVSYIELAKLKTENSLSFSALTISTFALCGFANFSSIAIQVGGLSVMAPEKRSVFSIYGFKALIAATLTGFIGGVWGGLLFC